MSHGLRFVNRRTKDEGRRTTAVGGRIWSYLLSSLVLRPSAAIVLRNTLAVVCLCVLALGCTAAQAALDGPGSGLVGWWKFDEGSGTIATDSSGNANNGTLTNGPAWAAGGMVGTGTLFFDGVDDYVTVARTSMLEPADAFTIGGWVRANTFASGPNSEFISKYGGNWQGFALQFTGYGNARPVWFTVSTNNPSNQQYMVASSVNLSLGQWYHVAGVFSSGAPLKIYVNGVNVGQGTENAYITHSTNLMFGRASWYEHYFNCNLDDIRYYNRALSDSEIMELYNLGSTLPDTQAPSVPAGLSATPVSMSQINLYWNAATDNVAVDGYRIYRNGTQITTTLTNSYSDTNLASNTAYSYTVSAFDQAGNQSGQSTSASGTTFVAPQYTLTVTNSGNGSGIVSGGSISCGASCSQTSDVGTPVILTATASAGSIFSGWAGGGCTGIGSCSLTLNSDTAVSANFDSAPSPTTTEWYVSPTATTQGSGSITNPWNLQDALQDNTNPANKNHMVKPGDTIWLRGGIYTGEYKSYLTGLAGNQVVVRSYPNEWAVLKSSVFVAYDPNIDSVLQIGGAYATYWGFEVSGENANVRVTQQTQGDLVTDINFTHGIDVVAPGIKLINLILHDNPACGAHVGFDAPDAEVYGTIAYYNGIDAPAYGRAHGFYLQNDTGADTIYDNIVFGNLCFGIKVYAQSLPLQNFDLQGNITFKNRAEDFYIGSLTPAKNISLKYNYTWGTGGNNSGSNFGIWTTSNHEDITAENNYFAGVEFNFVGWKNILFKYNKIIYTLGIGLYLPPSGDMSGYSIDNNSYYLPVNPTNFAILNSSYQMLSNTLTKWREAGFDLHSSVSSSSPQGVEVFVRPNKYESGRAHIVVYNWDKNDSVNVDISNSGLAIGDRFEVRDAQNYFGAPVLSGVYDGTPITLPMNLTVVAPYLGDFTGAFHADAYHLPQGLHTSKEFGVFVLIKTSTLYGDISGNGTVSAYDAALTLQQGRGVFEAAQIGMQAVGLF